MTHDLGRIGRYRLLRELGRGGMGVVYEAADPLLPRRLALKVLLAEGAVQARRRLRREAEIAARLSHPGLVTVHELGADEDADGAARSFIVMEYVGDRTLDAALPTLAREHAVDLLRQVAEAVGYAHRHGAVHRDLKPANVLLTDDGRPVVTDFGLARWEGDLTRLTASGAVMGSVHSMAPEQALGQTDRIGPAADVWALGVMLYQVLCAQRPFDGSTPYAVIGKILAAAPQRPRAHDPTIDRQLEAICLKALARAPQGRYPDATALAEDLARAGAGQPIRIPLPSSWVLLRAALRRRQRTVTLALVAAALLAAGGLAVVPGLLSRRARAAARVRAEAAFARGDWQAALIACERGLTRGPDATLARLAADCQGRLAAIEAGRRVQAARRSEDRERAARLEAAAATIRRARPQLYVANIDVPALRAEVVGVLAELDALTRGRATDARAWMLLGEGHALVGDLPGAEAALRRAVALAPRDGWVAYQLGQVLLQRMFAVWMVSKYRTEATPRALIQRLGREALACIERSGAQVWGREREVERHLVGAYRAFVREDGEGLRARCEEGIAQFGQRPGTEVYRLLLAWLHPFEQRERWFDEALAVRPRDAWALTLRADARFDARRLDAALADADAALAINPNLGLARLTRGKVFMLRARADRALVELDVAIQLEPRMAGLRTTRAMLRHLKGDIEGARADLERAIEVNPGFGLPYAMRARIRWDTDRDRDGALADWRLALSRPMGPDEPIALRDRARRLEAAGRLEHAERDLDRLLTLQGDDLALRVWRGRLRLRRRKLVEAGQDAQLVLGRQVDHVPALMLQAEVLDASGNRPAAIRALTRALAADPEQHRARLSRARLYNLTGQHPKAIADCSRVLKRQPGDAAAHQERGVGHMGLDDRLAAVVDFSAALEADPNLYNARYNRAAMYFEVKDLARALTDLDALVQRHPRRWAPWHFRARLRVARGALRPALDDLRRVRELLPPAQRARLDPEIRRLEARIAGAGNRE